MYKNKEKYAKRFLEYLDILSYFIKYDFINTIYHFRIKGAFIFIR